MDQQQNSISSPRVSTKNQMNKSGKVRYLKKQLTDLVSGISLNSALEGESVKVWTRGWVYSGDPFFRNLQELVLHVTDIQIIESINDLLVIIPPPYNESFIYLNPPIVAKMLARKSYKQYELVLKKDVVDYAGLSIGKDNNEVKPVDNAKVYFVSRSGFDFGIYFNLSGKVTAEQLQQDMLQLFKSTKFISEYSSAQRLTNIPEFIRDGWFPFFELLTAESGAISSAYKEEKPRRTTFMTGVVDRIISRASDISVKWYQKAAYQKRKSLLSEAVQNLVEGRNASAIKILLTEFEGILLDTWMGKGKPKKSPKEVINLLFADDGYNGPTKTSLIFPEEFIKYVQENIYANFDLGSDEIPNSRHPVAHGAANESQYTQEFACQTFLSLDNLWYFI